MAVGENQTIDRLKSLLKGDGEEIREQLIFAGLLLMIFERFKSYVTDTVDGFFSEHIEINNGKMQFVRGKKFKEIIKKNGAGQPGQHTNKNFRGALHWFYEVEAIERADFDGIERLYALRNEIGHEFLGVVVDGNKSPITLTDVLFAFGIYVKIVRWWIKEVEIATDPDMTAERYDSIDWDSIESGDTIILREILHKALSNNQKYADFLELLQSNT